MKRLVAQSVLIFALAGCGGDEPPAPPPTATPTAAISTATPAPSPTPNRDVENPVSIDAGDGVAYETTYLGEGRAIGPGDTPVFRARIYESESSNEIFAGEFGFRIDSGQAFPGFDRGVRGMKLGEKRTVRVPAAMGPPEAKANTIIEVELLRIDEEN